MLLLFTVSGEWIWIVAESGGEFTYSLVNGLPWLFASSAKWIKFKNLLWLYNYYRINTIIPFILHVAACAIFKKLYANAWMIQNFNNLWQPVEHFSTDDILIIPPTLYVCPSVCLCGHSFDLNIGAPWQLFSNRMEMSVA